jgi:hypothetical protein
MKPDEQQKQWLQDYLRAVLTYRETYTEVYDHILVALENKGSEPVFETTINNIIQEDFGGSNGLMNLEEQCKQAVIKNVRKQYWNYFFDCFKFPFVIFSIMIVFCEYYISRYFSVAAIAAIFCFVLLSPIILLAIRGYKTGYVFGNIKTALRDHVFRRIAYKPFYWLLISMAIPFRWFKIHIHFDRDFHIIYLSLVLLLLMIHAFSLFKLYKDEFKMSITQ